MRLRDRKTQPNGPDHRLPLRDRLRAAGNNLVTSGMNGRKKNEKEIEVD